MDLVAGIPNWPDMAQEPAHNSISHMRANHNGVVNLKIQKVYIARLWHSDVRVYNVSPHV
jgi:hypothetical protein